MGFTRVVWPGDTEGIGLRVSSRRGGASGNKE